jgi:outer membrane receptor for ferrienterochelin and colicins
VFALIAAVALFLSMPIQAQTENGTLQVIVRSRGDAIAGAVVSAASLSASTDRNGVAVLTVEPGSITITVTKDGYLPGTSTIQVAAGERREATIELPRLEDEVVVSATRSTTRIEDQPLRVEVIDREEIEEKAMMTPGNVAMLVAETTGLRIQTTAPSLGGANVRIQGLRGRYSQLLADGLPLYGTQADTFSLLQVPPLDLGRVEVIKGVASALYGASALGGVVNLVSRQPRATEHQLLFNGTSQTGRDVSGWWAHAPSGGWSWTLLGSYSGQNRRDLDGDGWSDLPAFNRMVLRPRVFFDNQRGSSVFFTLGVIDEERSGGTEPAKAAPDGRPFEEALTTRHLDGGVVGRWLMGDRILSVRGALSRQAQQREWGFTREDGTRSVAFGEASLQGVNGRHTWVVGTAYEQDRYAAVQLQQFDYRFWSPAAFAQDEIAFGRRWTVGLSARADRHSEYGTLATPRLSLLVRPSSGWTVRIAAGTGAFAPTPFTEETEETGLSRVLPLRNLRAERARELSVDVTRVLGPLEITGTVFGSIVDDPVQLRIADASHVELANVTGPTRTSGTEVLVRYRAGEVNALFTHDWIRSTELDPNEGTRREVPLTPGTTMSFSIIWEIEGRGRLGFEAYYTGRQSLEENAYRTTGAPYGLIGALAEKKVGRVSLFVNCENLANVRQTNYDPLVLPMPRPDGRWTVDAWAPLDGRVANAGVRVFF